MKDNKTKFTIMSILTPILVPIIIIVLIAGAVIAIFNGIIDIITSVLDGIFDFLTDPLGFIGNTLQATWNTVVSILPDWTPGDYSFDDGGVCTVFLDSSIVDELADALSSGGMLKKEVSKGTLDLEDTGLTKNTLRELIVASYVTQATTDTIVGIEIPAEEMDKDLKESLDDYVDTGNIPVLSSIQDIGVKLFNVTLNLFENREQERGGENGNEWAYIKFGRYYYYVVKTKDSEDKTSYKYYFAEKGAVQIQDEDGNALKCYDQNKFNQYVDWFNGDLEFFNGNSLGNADPDKAADSYKNDMFYTVSEIGKITLVSFDNKDDSYTFKTMDLDYASDTEISNCTVPIEVLVDFLNISASSDFLTAFEELIKGQEIIIKVYPLTTTETVETHTEQEVVPTANFKARFTLVENMEEYEESSEEDYNGYHYYEQSYNLTMSPVTITSDAETTSTSTKYELALEKANTWYLKAKREISKSESTNKDIKEETISGGSKNFNNIDETIDAGMMNGDNEDEIETAVDEIQESIPSIPGMPYETLTDKTEVYDDEATISVEIKEGKKTVTTTVTTEFLSKGTLKYDDNTDAFLGLWKNEDGEYHQYANYDASTGEISGYNDEALFDPDGKKVGYHDLYGDDNAYIGDLFVNADEELFELLTASASSERTESYANIMKYILHRYTNKDYGVTDFNQLLRLLGLNVKSAGGDFNVNTSTADGEKIKPTKDELKKAFESTPYKNVLLGDLDAIYDAQEKYNVNGIFTAAVAIVESSAGTDKSGRYGARRMQYV